MLRRSILSDWDLGLVMGPFSGCLSGKEASQGYVRLAFELGTSYSSGLICCFARFHLSELIDSHHPF